MFLSIALSKVVPHFIFLFDESQVTQSVNPVDRELWERAFTTLAVADREGETLLINFDISLFNIDSISIYNIAHHPSIHKASFFSNDLS